MAIAFSVVIFSTGAIRTQEPDSGAVATFFEPLNVPLVSIDVVATDGQGKPIMDLTRADFEIFEDGKPMEITHFYAARPGEVPQAQSVDDATRVPTAVSQDVYLALYFDDTNVNLRRRALALSRLAEFLEQPLPENVKTILVRFDGSLHVESNFSDDPAELTAAVERIRKQTPNDNSRDAYALIRDMQGAASGYAHSQTAQSGFFDPMGGSPNNQLRRETSQQVTAETFSNFAPKIKDYARQSQVRNRASLKAFEEFIRSMRGIPGRKAVLWVGNLELRPGDGLFRIWEQMFPAGPKQQAINPLAETMRYDMTPDLSDLINVTNSYRVTLYTLGPSGSRGGLSVSPEMQTLDTGNRPGHFGQQDVFGEQEAQHIMSDLTGGEMLVDSGNLGRQLEGIAGDLGSYYSLAYVPPDPGSGEVHKITIKVDRDGAELRYRRSYQDLGAEDHAADRTMAAAILGVVDNPLGIDVGTREQEKREDGNFLVPVSVRIPIGGLVLMPEAASHSAQVSILSVVRDSRGWLSDVHESSYPIQIDNKELLTAVAQNAEFVLGMVLREGPHRVAVGVRDDRSSTESTAFVDLVVGASETGGDSS